MLKRAAVAGTVTAVPARSIAQAIGPSAPYRNLTGAESRILEAIVARLIPSDELGPGALEAGASRYIDTSLSDALADALGAYRAGLAAVDEYSRTLLGGSFAELDADEQDRVLNDLEQNVAGGFEPDASAFFDLVLAHTIEGTFCDPRYGGNREFVGWELIGYPGIRLAVGADDQRMSADLTLSRLSAYDLPMFDDEPGGGDSE
jgi:gluconate 2-dehydrogenase gamma chain